VNVSGGFLRGGNFVAQSWNGVITANAQMMGIEVHSKQPIVFGESLSGDADSRLDATQISEVVCDLQ
jgi:hypothetical protein